MDHPFRTLQRAKSLTEQAAEAIRSRIVGGEFELGAPLSENALAAELGVSKTPVREALLRLSMEGLVTIKPQRQAMVFDLTAGELRALCELRETLEVGALRLAMARHRDALAKALSDIVGAMQAALADGAVLRYRSLDADFHQALFEHCANPYFLKTYEGFSFRVKALRTRLSAEPALNQSSLRDHRDIAALVASGMADEAAARLAGHVNWVAAEYFGIIAQRTAASS